MGVDSKVEDSLPGVELSEVRWEDDEESVEGRIKASFGAGWLFFDTGGIKVKGVVRKRDFWAILKEFGLRKAVRILLSRDRVALSILMK